MKNSVAEKTKCQLDVERQQAEVDANFGGVAPVEFMFILCQENGDYQVRQRLNHPPFFYCVEPRTGEKTGSEDCFPEGMSRDVWIS